TLRHRWTTVVGGLVSLFATFFMFASLPQTFQPTLDQDHSTVTIEMVPGSTYQQAGEVVRRAEAVLRQQPEVDILFSRVRVGGATINIRLKEHKARTSIEFERALAPLLNRIPDARISFRSQFGGGRDVMLNLGGDDPAQLMQTANRLVDEMSRVP